MKNDEERLVVIGVIRRKVRKGEVGAPPSSCLIRNPLHHHHHHREILERVKLPKVRLMSFIRLLLFS